MEGRGGSVVEGGGFDDQPGGEENDCEREQATDLHAAWKMGKETRIGFHHVFLPWSAVQGLVSIVYPCSKHKNDLAFRLVTKRTTERGSGRFSVPHAACSFHLIPEGFTSGENTSKVVYTRSHRFGSIEEHEARRVSLFPGT